MRRIFETLKIIYCVLNGVNITNVFAITIQYEVTNDTELITDIIKVCQF